MSSDVIRQPVIGQGYNFNGKRGDAMQVWLNAIKRDRNYARLLMGLPLRQPIRAGGAPDCRAAGRHDPLRGLAPATGLARCLP